jgi:DNA replication protein DnaC
MLANTTAEKLREMKLTTMAARLQAQERDDSLCALSFEDRLGLLVDEEYNARKSNRLKRLMRLAGFAYPGACLEDVEYRADRGLDKALITRLGSGGYIGDHRHIVLLGAAGSGKSYLACAFGAAACRDFRTVKYVRLPELMAEFAVARVEGTYRKMLKSLGKIELLILDEWLLYPLQENESRDLLELMERRYQKASTILCSQFDVGGWCGKLGPGTLAEAIIDRIIHDAYTIKIAGDDSMRKHKGIAASGGTERA